MPIARVPRMAIAGAEMTRTMSQKTPRFSRSGIAALMLVIGLLSPIVLDAAGSVPGPEFSLLDQGGRPLTPAALKGKPTLLQFGFTSCPVVCPTTLHEIAGLMQELGPLADQINVVFVTVDPARDTTGVLKRYIASFDERIVGVTGSEDGIAALASALGAAVSKTSQGSDYAVSHPVYAYLLDRNWLRAGTLYVGPSAKKTKVLETLKGLIGASSGS